MLKAEAGQKILAVCRQHGISEHTFCHWRAKYGGMEVSDAERLYGHVLGAGALFRFVRVAPLKPLSPPA